MWVKGHALVWRRKILFRRAVSVLRIVLFMPLGGWHLLLHLLLLLLLLQLLFLLPETLRLRLRLLLLLGLWLCPLAPLLLRGLDWRRGGGRRRRWGNWALFLANAFFAALWWTGSPRIRGTQDVTDELCFFRRRRRLHHCADSTPSVYMFSQKTRATVPFCTETDPTLT